jgi:kynureninase
MTDYQSKAEQLDSADVLKSYREKFYFPKKNGRDAIYLCGNSLGLQPKATESYLEQELNNWKTKGVEGHFSGEKPWVQYHHLSKKALGALVGALETEVVAMNNLTVNLHLAMATFYKPSGRRSKILIERGAFPSDFYAVYSQIELNGLNPREHLIELNPKDGSDYLPHEEIVEKINDLGDELALVLFPGIQYYTGQLFNIQGIAASAHSVGAKAGFDLAHTIGNVPLSLHEDEADFAVWCTYKYLNSGPGAVGGLYIHEKHTKDTTLPRMSGWWGHDADGRFKMDNSINPIPNVDGWQLSNLNILTHAAHLASLDMFEEAGLDKLRTKSIQLTGLLEEIIMGDEVLNKNIDIITPSDPEERGCQLSLYLKNHGKEIFNHVIDHGVILDWREPNVMRAAPVPFYNSFNEVYAFTSILKDAFLLK